MSFTDGSALIVGTFVAVSNSKGGRQPGPCSAAQLHHYLTPSR